MPAHMHCILHRQSPTIIIHYTITTHLFLQTTNLVLKENTYLPITLGSVFACFHIYYATVVKFRFQQENFFIADHVK